jgi:hypothetical protein
VGRCHTCRCCARRRIEWLRGGACPVHGSWAGCVRCRATAAWWAPVPAPVPHRHRYRWWTGTGGVWSSEVCTIVLERSSRRVDSLSSVLDVRAGMLARLVCVCAREMWCVGMERVDISWSISYAEYPRADVERKGRKANIYRFSFIPSFWNLDTVYKVMLGSRVASGPTTRQVPAPRCLRVFSPRVFFACVGCVGGSCLHACLVGWKMLRKPRDIRQRHGHMRHRFT